MSLRCPRLFKRCTSDTGFSPPQGGFLFLPLLCGFLFSECAMQKTGVVVEAVKIAPAVSVTAITFLGCQISDWVSIVTLTYTLTLLGHFIWKKLVRPWWRKRRLQTGVWDALQEQIGARPRCGTATVAALASFVYHFGETKFARSTLLRRINAGEGARAQRTLPLDLRQRQRQPRQKTHSAWPGQTPQDRAAVMRGAAINLCERQRLKPLSKKAKALYCLNSQLLGNGPIRFHELLHGRAAYQE